MPREPDRRPTSRLASALRRAAWPALGFVVVAFFGAYAVLGPNGLLAFGDYRRQIAYRERALQQLEARREMLRNRVALLDPRHANPDLVDELVRRELNVAHPDEVIMPLDGNAQ